MLPLEAAGMVALQLGQAACTPSAIGHFIRKTPWASRSQWLNDSAIGHVIHNVPITMGPMAGIDGDERICSICVYGAAEIHPVPQVTLQTRLRRPFWPNTEAFRAFINDRIVPAELNVCRNCRWRCGMELLGEVASCPPEMITRISARPS